MTILVLGACGFVGRGMMVYLDRQGYSVSGFDEPHKIKSFTEFGLKIFNLNSLMDEGDDNPLAFADVVVNCFGEISPEGPLYDKNVKFISDICKFIRKKRDPKGSLIRWIQISSVGVYGYSRYFSRSSSNAIVVDERSIINPTNAYEQSKVDGDTLLLNSHGQCVDLTLVRAGSVIDKTMRNSFVIHLIRAVRDRYFVYINDSTYRFNWIALTDLTHVIEACIRDDKSSGKTYLVSEDVPQSRVIAIVMKFFERSGRPFVIPQIIIFPACFVIGFLLRRDFLYRRVQNMTISVRYDSSAAEKLIGRKLNGCLAAVQEILEANFARNK